ncbi:P2Y purinoceptor 1-like [Odontesthes bonariensis]
MAALLNMSDAAEADVFLGFLNQSTASVCRNFGNGQWHCYILLVLFSAALPVGILGNVAVLINYTCLRKTLSSSRVFLLNLALCDSAWILTLPFTLYFKFQRPYRGDIQVFCRVKRISFNINIYGSILFLTLISFDRYVGTVHPIRSLRWWSAGKAKICSACAWVGLVLSSIPDLFDIFAIRRSANATACMDHIKGPFLHLKIITVIRTTVCFLLPFGAMLAFYIMTVCVLRRLRRGGRNGEAQPAGRKPLRLITASLLVFAVSFVPYHIMVITLVFTMNRDLVTPSDTKFLYQLCEAVCSLSSCLDPVLYIMASEQFKRKLLAFKRDRYRSLCCRGSRRVGVTGK